MERQPSAVNTVVYPLSDFDCAKLNRINVRWLFSFHDVLDAAKLECALVTLLSTGDWRKLTGRLRRGNDKAFALHVPDRFTKDTPAVRFVHDDMPGTKIADHPVAKHIPKPTNRPSVRMSPSRLRSLASPGMPEFRAQIGSDSPLLWIQVTTFADATVIGFAYSHVLMDACAAQGLLRAWSSMVNRPREEPPVVLGARSDFLDAAIEADVDAENQDKHILHEPCDVIYQRRRNGFAVVWWIIRHLWEWFTMPGVTATVCLPARTVSALRHRAEEDLSPDTFVSDNDILTAWVTQLSASSDPGSRPVAVIQAANVLSRLPALYQRKGVYLQNLIVAAWSFFSPQDAQMSVGQIAVLNRKQLLAQVAGGNVLRVLRTKRDDIRKMGNSWLFYGEANANILVMNNMTKYKIIRDLNFGAAVLRKGEVTESCINQAGTAVGFMVATDPTLRGPSVLYVLGNDHGGNLWLHGALRNNVWASLEHDLRRLDGL